MPMTVVVNGGEPSGGLVGVTDGFEQIRGLVVTSRALFRPGRHDFAQQGVSADASTWPSWCFPDTRPVGKEIRMGELHFTVIGVFRERDARLARRKSSLDSVIVPFRLIKDYTGEDYLQTLLRPGGSPGRSAERDDRRVEQFLQEPAPAGGTVSGGEPWDHCWIRRGKSRWR